MEVCGRKASEDQDNCPCKPCTGRNVSTRADGFCVECEEYMCNTCFDMHKQFRLNLEHTLTNSRESARQQVQTEELEKCDQHFNEMIKFYCPKHEQVGCGDCMILDHKACKVEYIRDKARTFKDSREFKDLVKGAEKCHTEAKKMLSSIKNNKVQIIDINEKFNQEVNMLKDEIMSHVTKMANAMLQQGRDVMEMDIERMNGLKKETEKMIDELSVLTKELESQIERPNKLFVSSILQKPKLKRLRDQLDSMTGKNKIEMFEFKRDENLERFVKECKQLGSLQRIRQQTETDLREKEARPTEIQQIVLAAGPPKPQPLLERQMICRNITVDGEYLSYADDGTGNVGLYVDKYIMRPGHYYEVEILSMGQRGTIAIGVVPESYPENLQPGCGRHSIGYHADDGKVYYGSGTEEKFGPKCNVGDRIGCGIRAGLELGGVYKCYVVFTRNGKKIGEKQISYFWTTRVHAAVGMHSACERVRVVLDAKKPRV